MRKFLLIPLLGSALVFVGCGEKSVDSPKDVCDQYFSVLECVVDKQVPEHLQEDAYIAIDSKKDQLNALLEEERVEMCRVSWEEDIIAQSGSYVEFGCSVE